MIIVAEKLRPAVESKAIQAATLFSLTVSIGVASWTSDDDSGDVVLGSGRSRSLRGKRGRAELHLLGVPLNGLGGFHLTSQAAFDKRRNQSRETEI
ncbi:MAG TPA: hypothetical protein VII29_05535 [Terriglobales bacterium]|jgi:hypothetical protein